MNLIRHISTSIRGLLFDVTLNRLMRRHGEQVRQDFELVGAKQTYWIELSQEHVSSPRIVQDDCEFAVSVDKQAKVILKSWQYFPASVRTHFLGLIKYIVWLRRQNSVYGQVGNSSRKVSEHVYEM